MLFYGIQLTENEIENLRIENLAVAPSNPGIGKVYFNTVDGKIYIYTATGWQDIIKGDAAGNGLTKNVDGSFTIKLNGTTLDVSADGIKIKAGGVGTTELADDSVDKAKINSDVAGSGLGQNADGSLEVKTGHGIEIDTDAITVDIDGSTLSKSATGLKVAATGITATELASDSVTTAKIKDGDITFAKLAAAAVEDSTDTLSASDVAIPTSKAVKDVTDALDQRLDTLEGANLDTEEIQDIVGTMFADSTTLDFSYTDGDGTSTAEVKDGAISTAKIANDAVDKTKIAADVAGSGLGQNADGSLEVNVDGSTLEISTDAVRVKDSGIVTAKIADGNVTFGKIASTDIETDLAVSAGSAKLVTAAAAKAYADSVAQGLEVKDPVRAATTANLAAISGLLEIDGVQLVADDRVLVKNQTNKVDNGVYLAKAGAWVRALDFDDVPDYEIDGGEFVFVQEGTLFADCGFVLVTNSPVVVGTNNIEFAQFSGAGQITAGNAMSKDGNVLDVNVDGTTIEVNADALRIKDSGVTNAKIADGTIQFGKLHTDLVETSTDTLGSGDTTIPTSKAVKDVTDALDQRLDTLEGASLDSEGIQDIVGAMLSDSSQLDFTYDDGAGTYSATIKDDSITKAMINSDLAGSGLGQNADGSLEVNAGQGIEIDTDNVTVKLDGATLAKSANGLKIKDAGVDSTQIKDDAILTAKIKDGEVTFAKLAGSAVEDSTDTLSATDTAVPTSKAVKAVTDAIADDVSKLVTLSGVAVDSEHLGTFTGATITDNKTVKGALQDIETAFEETDANVDDLVTLSGVAENAEHLGTFTGATIADDSTIKAALQALETSLEEVDGNANDLVTLSGVAENSADLGTFTGSTISDNSTIKAALQSLETSLEEVDGNANDLITLTGVAENATTLGSFTGATIADGSTVKVAIQSLETELELHEADTTAHGTTGNVVGTSDSQTLTNKTIDLDSNTVSNIETDNFKSGVISTDGTLSDNSDSKIATQKAIKTYVDTVAQGLIVKDSVRVATTEEIILVDEQDVDGVTLVAGNRVLVKNQTDAEDNGIYVVVDGGAWTRASDFDDSPATEVNGGEFFFVEEGTVYADCGFVLATNAPVVVGTTTLTFTQFSGAGQITAGAALTKSGNTLNVNVDSDTIEVANDALQLKAGGIDFAHFHAATVEDSTDTISATDTAIPTSKAVKNVTDAIADDVSKLVTLSGVAVDSTALGTFTGSTIVDDRTVKGALQDLETTLEEIDANANDLVTLSGVLENATHLGAFTGSTIADSSTVKSALQAIETAFETHDNDSSAHGVTGNVVGTSDSQTLTNKTIDVDNNTISNIETDNFKTGVIDTDLSAVNEAHTTIPSAKATKLYVDTVLASGKFVQNIGDGVATDFVIDHNLGTRDVIVQVRQVAAPYGMVIPSAIEMTTANSTTVKFASAIDTNEYRVVAIAQGSVSGPSAQVITLESDGWVAGEQIVAVTGITPSNIIMINPAPSSYQDWADHEIRATAQGSNSLTFTYSTDPGVDVSVNVVIL